MNVERRFGALGRWCGLLAIPAVAVAAPFEAVRAESPTSIEDGALDWIELHGDMSGRVSFAWTVILFVQAILVPVSGVIAQDEQEAEQLVAVHGVPSITTVCSRYIGTQAEVGLEHFPLRRASSHRYCAMLEDWR